MINFGIRQSFDRIEQIDERFSNLNVPVELALPYYWNIYEPIRPHLGEIADKIKSYRIRVLSVHAVQAPITNEKFKIWGREIGDFCTELSAKVVTLHPNNTNKTRVIQKESLKNLIFFDTLYQKDIVFSIETFSGKRRIFTPDEIIKFNLPMTLDVAHIKDNKKVWRILKNYKENIVNIHLSSKGVSQHHLPIDSFCKKIVDYLMKNKWNGNVILEYLPEFHGSMLTDLKVFEKTAKPSP